MLSRLSFLFFFFIAILLSSCGNEKATGEIMSTGNAELDILNAQIQRDTTDAELYFDRAMYYYDNNSGQLALKDIERAIRRDSAIVKYWLNKADILLENYESKDAIAVLETAKEKFPESDDVRIKLAHFQFVIKQYLPALTNLGQVIQRSPQNPDAYFERARIYDEVGDTANALKNYQRVTEFDADNRDAWLGMGDILFFQGKELAVQLYKNAIAIDPEEEGAYLAIANFYHQHDRLEEAKREYKSILDRFPDYPPAHFNLGLLYLEQDSIEKAHNLFNSTIEVNSDNGNAYLYRGITNKISGNVEAAREDFTQANQLLPLDDDRADLELNALD